MPEEEVSPRRVHGSLLFLAPREEPGLIQPRANPDQQRTGATHRAARLADRGSLSTDIPEPFGSGDEEDSDMVGGGG